MSQRNMNTVSSLKVFAKATLFLYAGLVSFHVMADMQDEEALYADLFPKGQTTGGQAVPASPKALQGFSDFTGDDSKPWTAEQLQEMKEAFRGFREKAPSSPMPDEAIPLWQEPGAPNGALAMPEGEVSGTSYDSIINKYAKEFNVSPKLVSLMIKKESNFNPMAVSPKGAKGLMQLMNDLVVQFNIDPYDPESNIKVGTLYMASLIKRYKGDVSLALAAYNAGPGSVDKYNGIPPYDETQNYVSTITAGLGNFEARNP